MDIEMAGSRGDLFASGRKGLWWTRLGTWCAQGWRIYRVAPLRIPLLVLMSAVATQCTGMFSPPVLVPAPTRRAADYCRRSWLLGCRMARLRVESDRLTG